MRVLVQIMWFSSITWSYAPMLGPSCGSCGCASMTELSIASYDPHACFTDTCFQVVHIVSVSALAAENAVAVYPRCSVPVRDDTHNYITYQTRGV